MRSLLVALGESDCESIGDRWLAQPVNAVSSLAFSLVGIVIVGWAFRAEGRERRFRVVVGSLLIATGIGSFLFHGPQSAGSQFAHDITFLAALLTLGIGNLGGSLGWPERRTWAVTGIAVLATGMILWAAPGATNVMLVVALVVLGASEVAIHRTGGGSGPWYLATAILLVIAGGLFLAGRTDSALCDPESPLQPHAAWHLVIAAAIGTYAVATAPARLRGTS